MIALDINKVAVIGPSFFGYVQAVAQNISSRGYDAQYFDERHSNSIFSKIFYRLGMNYLIRRNRKNYLDAIRHQILSEGFGTVLLVDVEVIDRQFVESLTAQGLNVHLYMWDSAKNKPGFVDMIGSVNSAASFEPVDCEELGMQYIPLFAEDLFSFDRSESGRVQNNIGFNGTMHSLRAKQLATLEGLIGNEYRISKLLYYHSILLYCIKCLSNPIGWRYISEISTQPFSKAQIAELYRQSAYVLDIHHPGQSGLTSRTFEALRSGAILITFNQSVKSLPPSLAARCVYIEDISDVSKVLKTIKAEAKLSERDDYFLSLERFVSDILDLMSLPQKRLN